MINLLPDSDKRALLKVYRYRLISVALGALSGVAILAAVVLVPSYVTTMYHVQSARQFVEHNRNAQEVEEHNRLRQRVADSALTIKTMSPEVRKSYISIMDVILKNKGSGNSVNHMSFSADDKKVFKVTVQGIASSRQNLQAFTNALGRESSIVSVDVPVSNFTKESNINYSFTVTGEL